MKINIQRQVEVKYIWNAYEKCDQLQGNKISRITHCI